MSLQRDLELHFSAWKPPPPAVEGRTSRDVTLSLSAGLYSCMGDLLLYKVERKEKIPPWVVVYSGGKTTKTIDNLAPCHPHRFRLQVLIKPSAVTKLADRLIDHHGDEETVRKLLGESDRVEHHKQKENSTADRAARLSSRWSADTWSGTASAGASAGASAACFCMAVRCGYRKQVVQMLEQRPQLVSVTSSRSGYAPLATAVRTVQKCASPELEVGDVSPPCLGEHAEPSVPVIITDTIIVVKAHRPASEQRGELSTVRLLVSAAAALEQRCGAGRTPLHLAVLSGNVAVADLLLESGADFQARDLNQLRVEHYAVDSCEPDMVKFVMDRGGDVGVRDSNGWTPLFRAVCQGAKTEVVEELVRRGSDVDVTDKARLTLAAAARLLRDRHGRPRESVLRLVDSQYQHGKVVASFTRLTKKISTFHSLLKQ